MATEPQDMIDPQMEREAGALLSFEDVEQRLIEAMLCAWRMPDRERGWVKVRSLWPSFRRHTWFGDYGESASDAPIRLPALTRREVGQMDEAFAWVEAVSGDDRRLIGLAITALARGENRVPWRKLLGPMGLAMGADGLRMRYGRAMRRVVERANGGKLPKTLSRG